MSLYNKNWYKLAIDISTALRDDFDVGNFLIGADYVDRNHGGVWGYNNDELTKMFNVEWLDYMKSMKLIPSSVLVFHRHAYHVFHEAHIDYMFGTTQPYIAINWVLGQDDSEMVWYHTPSDVDKKPRRQTQGGQGHEYVSWTLDEVTEIERYCIGNTPTLVRVDIPHNIIVNKNPRWSISARFEPVDLKNSNILQWHSIVDTMQEHIIDSDHQQ